MRSLSIAVLAVMLTACSSNGGGNYQRGPYGGAIQQQPVATNQTLGQSLHWGSRPRLHHHFQNCSSR